MKEIDYSSLDFSKMMANMYVLQPKQDPRVVYSNLFSYPEYHTKELVGLEPSRVLKYIGYVYDKGSPIRGLSNDINRVKLIAAELAGYHKNEEGRFPSHVEDFIKCKNYLVNLMIIRYVVQQKNALYTKFITYSELRNIEMNKLLSGGGKASEFDVISDKLDEIQQQILAYDNSKDLIEDFNEFYEDDQLKLRPEDIALLLKKHTEEGLTGPVVPMPEKKKSKSPQKKSSKTTRKKTKSAS